MPESESYIVHAEGEEREKYREVAHVRRLLRESLATFDLPFHLLHLKQKSDKLVVKVHSCPRPYSGSSTYERTYETRVALAEWPTLLKTLALPDGLPFHFSTCAGIVVGDALVPLGDSTGGRTVAQAVAAAYAKHAVDAPWQLILGAATSSGTEGKSGRSASRSKSAEEPPAQPNGNRPKKKKGARGTTVADLFELAQSASEAEALDTADWPKTGMLKHMGYRVGENGKGEKARRRILNQVIHQAKLPNVRDPYYVAEWGGPKTKERLYKLADCLATFARNASRSRGSELAIQHWEHDLDYLRRRHYDGMYTFDWPSTTHTRWGHAR